MDFSHIPDDAEAMAFRTEVTAFLTEHLTDDIRTQEFTRGVPHHEQFHRALAAKGWVLPDWPLSEGGAGLNPVLCRILADELEAARAPYVTRSTTVMVAEVVRRWGSDDLKAEVLPKVAAGTVRFALGYTEPDGGSDLAAARTRLTRSEHGWTIDGAKMFMTSALDAQFCLLLARSNPTVRKGFTTILAPLDAPGVEIFPLQTLGTEPTNAVFFRGVEVADRYRLGAVDDGWTVVSQPLATEHGDVDEGPGRLEEINAPQGASYVMDMRRLYEHAQRWAAAARPDGTRPIDDLETRLQLGRLATDIEICRNTPGPMARVLASELLIERAAAMLDHVGSRALISYGADGACEYGVFEWSHRFAQATAIYGGTTDVIRNIIAERDLGLPRFARSALMTTEAR